MRRSQSIGGCHTFEWHPNQEIVFEDSGNKEDTTSVDKDDTDEQDNITDNMEVAGQAVNPDEVEPTVQDEDGVVFDGDKDKPITSKKL